MMEEKGGGQEWHLAHPVEKQELTPSSVALGETRPFTRRQDLFLAHLVVLKGRERSGVRGAAESRKSFSSHRQGRGALQVGGGATTVGLTKPRDWRSTENQPRNTHFSTSQPCFLMEHSQRIPDYTRRQRSSAISPKTAPHLPEGNLDAGEKSGKERNRHYTEVTPGKFWTRRSVPVPTP